MVFAFVILYAMKSLKMISFTSSESLSSSNNSAVFVSFRTLAQTLPLALTYLLFMVSNCKLLSLFGSTSFLQPLFLIIGGDNGSSARDKHSYVHHAQANCSGLHNGYGVFSLRADTFKTCCWKVLIFV